MNRRTLTGLLVVLALATWPIPWWAYWARFGSSAWRETASATILGAGAISLALRLHFRRNPGRFGIFFPIGGGYRGEPRAIRLMAVLLAVFDLGTPWLVSRLLLSQALIQLMLVAVTYSAMNLADEAWAARRAPS